MKKIIFTLSVCCAMLISVSHAQLKVGRTKDEIKAEKDKATAKLIGTNGVLGVVMSEYKLYRLGDTTEIFAYTVGNNVTGKFTFSSVLEEKDFYEYVLTLFDDFKDNEFFIGKTRIVPLKMGNFAGTKNLAFNINPDGASYTDKTLVIGKAGWERLFKKSIIKGK